MKNVNNRCQISDRMSVEIPAQYVPFVKDIIAHGNYSSEQEVFIAGLKLIQERIFREKIEAGLRAAEEGRVLSDAEVFVPYEAKAAAMGTTLDELAAEDDIVM